MTEFSARRERPASEPDRPSARPGAPFWLMTGLSGFACLIYQILWMRQAGLSFGSTAQATALTLAVFLGGLSLGGRYWGGRCQKYKNPLRSCAWLELGIAAAGILILIAPAVVPRIYPVLYQKNGNGLALMAFKLASTLLMVFPASFLMGGTLPMLGQAIIRRREAFGATTARMYTVNTLGAACGAFATAFVLIGWLGLRMTCVMAMACSVAAALVAFRLSRQACFQAAPENALGTEEPGDLPHGKMARRPDPPPAGMTVIPRPLIVVLAFVSGFNLLALEVVWTRMLAQVHENSVNSFATVLIVVLVCLSLGAWLASRLARSGMAAPQVLLWLFALGGTALAITQRISIGLTDGMAMLRTDFSFAGYALRLFGTGFAVIGPACLPLGAVFPFLMKSEEGFATHAGKSIGTLSAINTIGAIIGSLAAGFLLLEWWGVWHAIQGVSAIYLLVAVLTPAAGSRGAYAARIASCVMLALLLTALNPARLADSSDADPAGKVVEKWEGSDCTVTVVGGPGKRLSIRINSNYSLGSTDAYGPQIFQARIPLLAYPATDSVFFLGMGTGITAGEALNRGDFKQVRRVVACELSPNVVAASKKYFTGNADGFDPTNGLYQDPRADVVIGDGRNHLLANREQYAMINADLFLPYRRGTGNLYSREHFRIVLERLKPGGAFVQWLPLYQMSEPEFGIIARTMLAVFPQVSLWRGNFQPGAEIAALVGHADHSPLPASALDAGRDMRLAVEGASHLDMQELMLPINEQTILLFYGGNLTRATDLFAQYLPLALRPAGPGSNHSAGQLTHMKQTRKLLTDLLLAPLATLQAAEPSAPLLSAPKSAGLTKGPEATVLRDGKVDKPLFIGEFGAPGETPEQAARCRRLLKAIIDHDVPLAALWVFDLKTQKEWSVTAGNARAWQLDLISEANQSRPRKPLIGVTSLTDDNCVRAFRESGAIPVILPNKDASSTLIDKHLENPDGLLLPGGTDIPPPEWNGQPHTTTTV